MGSLTFDKDQEDNSHFVTNPLDPKEFRRQGQMIIDFIADYYKNIERYQVVSQVEPNFLRKFLPESAPYSPESIETILQDVQKYIISGITHWQSPNYFAYFPSSGNIAGFLGEMLSTGFNVVGFNWMSSPAATELECISFLFSGNGGSVLQGTTCEAILCTLTAATDQMLSQVGREKMEKLVVYGSDQTHSAIQKAAKIVGINPMNFRAVKTTNTTSFGLCPKSLRDVVQADLQAGLVPFFLCARPLCEVAKDYSIRVYVDAAYAGSACICPEFRHFIDGIEGANSFTLNAHKWFFTTLDCCCLWVKDPSALIKSISTNPAYSRNKAADSKQVVDYKDCQITLSQRFRAMKLWVVLRSYGMANLRCFLRSNVKMAKLFEELVMLDNRFEVMAPRKFALVCFRVLPKPNVKKLYENGVANHDEKALDLERVNELNQKLSDSINKSGHVYVSYCVATQTEERHVIMAWKVVQEHADALLSRY
ncbi:hypothetical protein ACB092_11G124200 [Castanea dentata]